MARHLRRQGFSVGRKRIRRLMPVAIRPAGSRRCYWYRFQRLFRTDNLSEDFARRLWSRRRARSWRYGFEGNAHDRALQFCDAFESAPADAFFGDLGKKALNHVGP